MKTRHIAAAALGLLLMTGCANSVGVASMRPSPEQPTEPPTEAETVPATEVPTEEPAEEAPAEPTEADIPEQETEPATIDYVAEDIPWSRPVQSGEEAWEVNTRYTFEVEPEGVSVYYLGSRVQLLEADCSWASGYDNPASLLTLKDYDMDGFDDIFIPENTGAANQYGRYYCLNTSTGRFDSCEELDDKLGGALASVGDDGLLTVHGKDSASSYEDRQFRWFSGELALVQRKVQYLGSDGELYVDTYSVMGTDEELIARERVLLDSNNEWLGTEDVPLN